MAADGRRGPNYPLLVGLITLTALIFLWNLPSADQPVPLPFALDAAVPVPDAEVAPAVPVLAWTLAGAALPSQGDLTACLRGGGWDRIRVLGGGARPLSVTHGAVTLAVAPTPEGLAVRTPLMSGRHLAVSLHAAVAACVGAQATALVDPVTGRHADKARWPTPRREAGLPLPLLVATRAGAGYLVTEGLARLGLFEVVLVGADTPRHRRVLERAAVAALLADDPAVPALALGSRTVALAGSEVAWWPASAPAGARALADGGGPFAPPAEAEPRAPESRPESRPDSRPEGPRSAPPLQRSAQPPTVPRRTLPTAPTFRPTYR